MSMSERDTCSTQVSSLASGTRRAETNRVEMETGFRLSIRPRTLLDRLCREKSKKNAEKILATGIRSFEPASTPLRMCDSFRLVNIRSEHRRDTLSYQFLGFLYLDEKYFWCTRLVRGIYTAL